MAVIKIVPMPGAEGQQGEAGAVGPQGPQGDTGEQGPAGADAVWYYNGEYNPGASYVIGDVVTYDGQLWYRKHANGGNVGDTPSEGFIWDLVAAKGQDSINPTSGTWNPRFAELSNITYNGDSSLYEVGEYYCVGDLVFFDVFVKLSDVLDWGTYDGTLETSGSLIWGFELPFKEKHYYNYWQLSYANPMFVGELYDSTVAENIEDRTGRDQGSYAIFGKVVTEGPNSVVRLYVTAYDSTLGNSLVGELRSVTKNYPSDLTQPEIQESGFRMSGVYRKA